MSTVSVVKTAESMMPDDWSDARPDVRGKFIFFGSHKFFIKGVTYGAFRPNDAGVEFRDVGKIRRDLALMARSGINTIRVQHTVPPPFMLDLAADYHLRVMVGLSAEQYVGHLLDGKNSREGLASVRSKVREVGRHPAVLCYALGNEIPANAVRWLGRERVERYLHELYNVVKDEDPEALVTYANYPSTEYLQLPFLDLCCFNVYLEKQDEFEAYLARLQNIALDRPLVMSELGLDSRRNGVAVQARVLESQIRTSFEKGCAGAVVFSWTDEWYRGGDVEEWEFGLTDWQRRPRPALSAVSRAFSEGPFASLQDAPLMSVVVCSYNGSRTIGECLEHVSKLNYPNYEVIVVDDGSTDNTAEIAQRYDVLLIQTENRGLSSARNTGSQRARGEIVVYIDDDAYPDADWLNFYSSAFQQSTHAMMGGPNFVPLDDPAIAQCVARAPGGPNHVLLTDTLAEHVPGCNMAFRKECLEEIGGFDSAFRIAGDDVDICWRIQDRGWTIGFAPSAVVWHHRRSSLRMYLKQQRGYGKAEALLHRKWPGRFNASNHVPWMGRIYTAGVNFLAGSRSVIYHGVWGEAPFQHLHSAATIWEHLTEVPELYLLNAALFVFTALGFLWRPMLLFAPLLCLSAGYPLLRASLKASRARFTKVHRSHQRWMRGLTAVLYVIQPLARLWGRLEYGLTPWKRRGNASAVVPYRRQWTLWTTNWIHPYERRHQIQRAILANGMTVQQGNEYESWDLEVLGGLLGSARVRMAVEDHGGGRQYVRVATWPRYSKLCLVLILVATVIGAAGAFGKHFFVSSILLATAALLFGECLSEAGRSLATVLQAVQQQEPATAAESHVAARDPFPEHSRVASWKPAAVPRSSEDG